MYDTACLKLCLLGRGRVGTEGAGSPGMIRSERLLAFIEWIQMPSVLGFRGFRLTPDKA